jgi:hypothetical protein
MTDRELLEFAAKAAVIDALRLPHAWPDRFDDDQWNPLADDGDALRLACHLRINIEHIENSGRRPFGVNCWPLGRGDCGHTETDVTDYNAATRRAIVRAAAEIGRNMP